MGSGLRDEQESGFLDSRGGHWQDGQGARLMDRDSRQGGWRGTLPEQESALPRARGSRERDWREMGEVMRMDRRSQGDGWWNQQGQGRREGGPGSDAHSGREAPVWENLKMDEATGGWQEGQRMFAGEFSHAAGADAGTWLDSDADADGLPDACAAAPELGGVEDDLDWWTSGSSSSRAVPLQPQVSSSDTWDSGLHGDGWGSGDNLDNPSTFQHGSSRHVANARWTAEASSDQGTFGDGSVLHRSQGGQGIIETAEFQHDRSAWLWCDDGGDASTSPASVDRDIQSGTRLLEGNAPLGSLAGSSRAGAHEVTQGVPDRHSDSKEARWLHSAWGHAFQHGKDSPRDLDSASGTLLILPIGYFCSRQML
jgi:hypothetical protein